MTPCLVLVDRHKIATTSKKFPYDWFYILSFSCCSFFFVCHSFYCITLTCFFLFISFFFRFFDTICQYHYQTDWPLESRYQAIQVYSGCWLHFFPFLSWLSFWLLCHCIPKSWLSKHTLRRWGRQNNANCDKRLASCSIQCLQ